MAATYPILCQQGATFQMTFLVKDANVPRKFLTGGYSAKMQVRPWAGSSTLIVELSTANGGITLDDNGNMVFFWDAVPSDAVAAGTFVYDVETSHFDGVHTIVERLVEGQFTIEPVVTQ